MGSSLFGYSIGDYVVGPRSLVAAEAASSTSYVLLDGVGYHLKAAVLKPVNPSGMFGERARSLMPQSSV